MRMLVENSLSSNPNQNMSKDAPRLQMVQDYLGAAVFALVGKSTA
jgi:hypothetical protein